MGMGWHYRRSYETVLVGEKRGGPCRWYGDNRVENIIRPDGRVPKIIPSASDHPTPKPPALAAHFIRLHSEEGHIVLDPFMGGGSTAVAARALNRRFVGIELEEKYCEIAVQRVAQRSLFEDAA
jgi:DNA modification methylase